MVRIDVARKANAALVSKHPLVAVFVGATSGIGEYTLRALATNASTNDGGKGLRVYLAGRNSAAAYTILADCRKLCPQADFHFIKADDLSLLQDVDKCCEQIKKDEKTAAAAASSGPARIDLLVQSQGMLNFGARQGKALHPISKRHF